MIDPICFIVKKIEMLFLQYLKYSQVKSVNTTNNVIIRRSYG